MAQLGNLILGFFWGLVPQKDDDMVQIYQWRWKTLALGLMGLLLGLYAADLIPGIAPPYAMADVVIANKSDLQQQLSAQNSKLDDLSGKMSVVMAQLHDNQVHQINSDLMDARRYQCRAISSADKTALPFWTARIQELKYQFRALTSGDWFEQDCNTF